MKAQILSMSCLALFGFCMTAIAQEDAQPQKPASTKAITRTSHGHWKQVGEGVWEAKIPHFADDPQESYNPEFAVLRLTDDTYAEFQKDHVSFLNKYKIFGKDVLKQEQCSEAKPKTPRKKVGFYYLTVPHWPSSTASCQAYTGWSEPRK